MQKLLLKRIEKAFSEMSVVGKNKEIIFVADRSHVLTGEIL